MTGRFRVGRDLCLGLALVAALAAPATSQEIDARLVSPGILRVAFTPQWNSWDQVFGAGGASEPLGKYFSSSAAGSDLFPTLTTAENAVRAITGDASYRINLGAITTRIDADVRNFPFELSVGLNRRITLTATVPIIVTRVNAAVRIDTTNGNAGYNQAAPFLSGGFNGQQSIVQLLSQLEAGAAALDAGIASGSYGCPGSASCADAQNLVIRTRALETQIAALTAIASNPRPPAAPTAGSSAGAAITAAIQAISDALVGFGVTGISATLPLPTQRVDSSAVSSILGGADSLGYDAVIPRYTKRPHLGDISLGMRFGLVDQPNFRFTLVGSARLPTGTVDSPDNLVDIGTGDHQIDIVGGFETAVEPGPLSFTAAGSYSLQLPGSLVRRVTPPQQPLALSSTTATVTRNPGDMIWLAGFPALRLAEGFRVYGSVAFFHKGSDRFSGDPNAGVLDQLTSMRSLSVGGGLSYRSVSRETTLPIDAGMNFQRTVSGSGGFTPKSTIMTIYLRFYYHLWGGS